jgi:hypothetical protein
VLDKTLADVRVELLNKEHADALSVGATHDMTATSFLVTALDLEQMQ